MTINAVKRPTLPSARGRSSSMIDFLGINDVTGDDCSIKIIVFYIYSIPDNCNSCILFNLTTVYN